MQQMTVACKLCICDCDLQIGSAEQYAQAGDVILSPEVTGVVAGHCTVDTLQNDNSRLVSMSQQEVVKCSWHPFHPIAAAAAAAAAAAELPADECKLILL